MTIGVLREGDDENRVVLLPEHVPFLVKKNLSVLVEKDAGKASYARDQEYTDAGATVQTRANILKEAGILLSINPPEEDEIPSGKVLVSILGPLTNKEMVQKLAKSGVTSFSLAMIGTMVLHRDGAGMGIKGGNLAIILGAIAFGGVVGGVIARRIKMTAMPQLVSFFNATGGAASALVALIEFSNPDNQSSLVTLLGLVIGSIAFSGSMIAYGKLNGNNKYGLFVGIEKLQNAFHIVCC